jgi:Rrf2 family transcriptional regulator, iron-sulfur cluster assembly transcription factor
LAEIKSKMFSKTCEYGIKAVVFIANTSDTQERVNLKSIAEAIDSPEAFTAKILQQLVRSNLVDSQKGPNGGFFLEAEKLDCLVLADVVNAIDGDSIFKECGLGLKNCDELRPCPMHDEFKEIRDNLESMLQYAKISELAFGLNEGVTFLK